MNKRFFNLALAVLLTAVLSGCTWSSKKDYDDVGSTRPLEVPPDLSSLPRSDQTLFGRPASGGADGPKDAESDLEDKLLPTVDNIKVKRAGQHRWLEIKARPAQVWNAIQKMLSKHEIPISREDLNVGFIETDWQESKALTTQKRRGFLRFIKSFASADRRDRFRIRLERGSRSGVTEVYVSHYLMVEEIESGGYSDVTFTKWTPRPADPEREIEMLATLMAHFGVEEEKIEQKIKQAQPTLAKTKIKADDTGRHYLIVEENPDEAWRRLGISLDRVGLVVEDRDRKAGIYYVRYVKNKGGKSFLRSLFLDNDEYLNYLQIRTKQVKSTTTEVRIFDKDGSIFDETISKGILTAVGKEFSR